MAEKLPLAQRQLARAPAQRNIRTKPREVAPIIEKATIQAGHGLINQIEKEAAKRKTNAKAIAKLKFKNGLEASKIKALQRVANTKGSNALRVHSDETFSLRGEIEAQFDSVHDDYKAEFEPIKQSYMNDFHRVGGTHAFKESLRESDKVYDTNIGIEQANASYSVGNPKLFRNRLGLIKQLVRQRELSKAYINVETEEGVTKEINDVVKLETTVLISDTIVKSAERFKAQGKPDEIQKIIDLYSKKELLGDDETKLIEMKKQATMGRDKDLGLSIARKAMSRAGDSEHKALKLADKLAGDKGGPLLIAGSFIRSEFAASERTRKTKEGKDVREVLKKQRKTGRLDTGDIQFKALPVEKQIDVIKIAERVNRGALKPDSERTSKAFYYTLLKEAEANPAVVKDLDVYTDPRFAGLNETDLETANDRVTARQKKHTSEVDTLRNKFYDIADKEVEKILLSGAIFPETDPDSFYEGKDQASKEAERMVKSGKYDTTAEFKKEFIKNIRGLVGEERREGAMGYVDLIFGGRPVISPISPVKKQIHPELINIWRANHPEQTDAEIRSRILNYKRGGFDPTKRDGGIGAKRKGQ